jgi:hypothetical protein
VFFLLAISHVARILAEGIRLLTEPIFISTTILSVALFAWSAVLFKRAVSAGT